MKVAVNARLLRFPSLRGWNRYTVNLLAELPGVGVEPVLYSDGPILPEHLARLPEGGFSVRVSPPLRNPVWVHRWLPRQCALDGVDLLHGPFNFELPWSSPCPQVLTLHDAIEEVYAPPLWARLRPADWKSRLAHWIARTRAQRIITVSEHSRNDIHRLWRVPLSKIDVTPEAADPHFQWPVDRLARERTRRAHDLRRPYGLYLGGWERRKNVPFLVRAFAEAAVPDVELVLAGGRDEERAALSGLAGSLGVADRLRLLGWIDDTDLPALYAEALCFVYPSEYEGFGLQLCEAMACGCPTLAARATCLPEVLGDGGETFALEGVGELAGLLRRVAADESFRSDLVRRARTRVAAFSWRRTAEETLASYQRALEMRRNLARGMRG